MRLLFAGTPEVALPSLELLAASGHELVGVVTRPDAPRGRSGRPVPSPVGAWADDHGVETLKPHKASDEGFLRRLRELAPDACPVVAYGNLLPQAALDVPRFGWINLHFSLLPRWRGAAPAQRTIIAGDAVAGATTFRVTRPLDAGPVYRTLRHPLAGTETAGALLSALASSGAELLLATIDELGSAVPVEQPEEGVTLAPKLTADDARLDWSLDGEALARLVRGCSPEPMAWTTLQAERVNIADARALTTSDLAPGQLRPERRRLVVGTGTVDVELLRVQPQGKKEMAGADWGRGLHAARISFDVVA